MSTMSTMGRLSTLELTKPLVGLNVDIVDTFSCHGDDLSTMGRLSTLGVGKDEPYLAPEVTALAGLPRAECKAVGAPCR